MISDSININGPTDYGKIADADYPDAAIFGAPSCDTDLHRTRSYVILPLRFLRKTVFQNVVR